ncbi:hypothetical protein LCGC14_3146880, partial [marine sediment metagenome]
FWEQVEKSSGCWIWKRGCFANGYGQCVYQGKHWKAHRLAWVLSFGIIPDGGLVLHSCDNKRCVNPNHLFVGSQKDNIQDALMKGRMATGGRNGAYTKPESRVRNLGEGNGSAKLSWVQIHMIRKQYASGGVSQEVLGKEFGVSQTTVGEIIRRENWKTESQK